MEYNFTKFKNTIRNENIVADQRCLATERGTLKEGEIWEWKHLIESEASQVALGCTHSVDKLWK